jgi:hypothetical protein
MPTSLGDVNSRPNTQLHEQTTEAADLTWPPPVVEIASVQIEFMRTPVGLQGKIEFDFPRGLPPRAFLYPFEMWRLTPIP